MTYMTGALPSHHHVQDWLIPEDSFGPGSHRWLDGFRTYPEVLANAGYTMGMCGKWHMGDDDKAQVGFSYWATVPGGGGTYRDPRFVHNGTEQKIEGFKTDIQTDFALDFLEKNHNKEPFYLLMPFYAPHTPFDLQPERDRKWYNDSNFPCFPNTPQHQWQSKGLAKMHGNREAKHAYSALISGVDYSVGRVLDRLDKLRVRENTLVVFTADQGWNAGHHGVWGKGNGTTPFNMYEESLRVPLIWNHPGRVKAGHVSDAMVSTYDYYHTILDYVGLEAPKDARHVGRSYAPFLRGQKPAWRNRLYFEYAYVRAIRTGNMKYVERTDGYPTELFDIEADPGETRSVANDPSYKKQLEALRQDLTGFFQKAGAPPLAEWRKTTTQKLPWDKKG